MNPPPPSSSPPLSFLRPPPGRAAVAPPGPARVAVANQHCQSSGSDLSPAVVRALEIHFQTLEIHFQTSVHPPHPTPPSQISWQIKRAVAKALQDLSGSHPAAVTAHVAGFTGPGSYMGVRATQRTMKILTMDSRGVSRCVHEGPLAWGVNCG
mmetsp:Transcript_61036/g.163936  ORF Transcript_61036/g.163936 Transcript_61036/m.163936 type:complete len:153 (-) Transcript_61036:592-1050(-)